MRLERGLQALRQIVQFVFPRLCTSGDSHAFRDIWITRSRWRSSLHNHSLSHLFPSYFSFLFHSFLALMLGRRHRRISNMRKCWISQMRHGRCRWWIIHVVVSHVSPEKAVQTHLRLVLGVRHTWTIGSCLASQHGHILFILGSAPVYFCPLDTLNALI